MTIYWCVSVCDSCVFDDDFHKTWWDTQHTYGKPKTKADGCTAHMHTQALRDDVYDFYAKVASERLKFPFYSSRRSTRGWMLNRAICAYLSVCVCVVCTINRTIWMKYIMSQPISNQQITVKVYIYMFDDAVAAITTVLFVDKVFECVFKDKERVTHKKSIKCQKVAAASTKPKHKKRNKTTKSIRTAHKAHRQLWSMHICRVHRTDWSDWYIRDNFIRNSSNLLDKSGKNVVFFVWYPSTLIYIASLSFTYHTSWHIPCDSKQGRNSHTVYVSVSVEFFFIHSFIYLFRS